MSYTKTAFARDLLFGPLEPEYSRQDKDYVEAVAIVAAPFNCYLRGQRPDQTNLFIARLAAEYMRRYSIPFIGQWEQTNLLEEWGLPVLKQMETFSGERVESQRLGQFQAEHVLPLGRKVIRIGMPQHVGRCTLIDRYFGLEPMVPVECKHTPYDPTHRPGVQLWCTTQKRFTRYERCVARPGTAAKLLLGMF